MQLLIHFGQVHVTVGIAIKKLYKTKNGILTFLDYQMKNWTEKHIKIK